MIESTEKQSKQAKRKAAPLIRRYPVLRMALAERALTLAGLAKRLKVSRPGLSRALSQRGKQSSLIPAVCAELNVTEEELFRKRRRTAKQELPLAA